MGDSSGGPCHLSLLLLDGRKTPSKRCRRRAGHLEVLLRQAARQEGGSGGRVRRAKRACAGASAALYTRAVSDTEVLMICTANICRSPIAEALLARALADRQIDARVRSAGRLSGGRPPTRAGLQITRRMGLNLDAHRSQQVTDRMIRDSDLVVGMAREHVLYAVGLAPEALPRSFTLKDLVRRAEAVGPRKPDEMLGDWLAAPRGDAGTDGPPGLVTRRRRRRPDRSVGDAVPGDRERDRRSGHAAGIAGLASDGRRLIGFDVGCVSGGERGGRSTPCTSRGRSRCRA